MDGKFIGLVAVIMSLSIPLGRDVYVLSGAQTAL